MKTIKFIITLVLITFSLTTFSQTKITEPVKETIDLITLDFEYVKSGPTTYFSYTLFADYKYPNIKEGYYTIGIFEDITGLVNLYEQLVNVSKMTDGEYRLIVGYTKYDVTKKGTKIYFNRVNGEYIPLGKKIKGDTFSLESDLNVLKLLSQTIDK